MVTGELGTKDIWAQISLKEFDFAVNLGIAALSPTLSYSDVLTIWAIVD